MNIFTSFRCLTIVLITFINNTNSSGKYAFREINSSKQITLIFGYDVDLSCSIEVNAKPYANGVSSVILLPSS